MKRLVRLYFDRKPYFTLYGEELDNIENSEYVKVLTKWGFTYEIDAREGVKTMNENGKAVKYAWFNITKLSVDVEIDIDDIFQINNDFGEVSLKNGDKKEIRLD